MVVVVEVGGGCWWCGVFETLNKRDYGSPLLMKRCTHLNSHNINLTPRTETFSDPDVQTLDNSAA